MSDTYRKMIKANIAKLHTAIGMKANPLLDSDLGADIVADIVRTTLKKQANEANKQPETKALALNSVSPCFYTSSYINWMNKYFKPCQKVYDFQRINDGKYYTKGQLHRRYEKAMLESPFK